MKLIQITEENFDNLIDFLVDGELKESDEDKKEILRTIRISLNKSYSHNLDKIFYNDLVEILSDLHNEPNISKDVLNKIDKKITDFEDTLITGI